MKHLSIQKILLEIKNTCIRFPFALLFASVTTCSLVCAINDGSRSSKEEFCFKIALFGMLGFFALISPVLLAESQKWKRLTQLMLQFVVAGFVVLYYFVSPKLADFKVIESNSFALLLILSFTLITILPFLSKNNQMGFWQFNGSTIFHFFLSGLYAGILWGGIVLGMNAIHFLFDVAIDEVRRPQLLFIVYGLFGSCFFLNGISSNFENSEENFTYPKGLKFFTQYILLTLVGLYFIILYVYAARILIFWELPKGWVSYLVLALTGIAVLAFLFVWPIRNNKDNNWIRHYSKYLYVLLLPLLVLLFVAIGRRITDYGVTSNRYYIFALACWATAICLYFIFSKRKDIRIIPMSLSLLVVLIMVGPWSVFSVSRKSQIHLLETILSENKVLVEGKIDTKHPLLSDSIEVKINTILDFLGEMNALPTLGKRWHADLGDTTHTEIDRYIVADALKLTSTDLSYFPSRKGDGDEFSFYISNKFIVPVSGFDYYIHDNGISSNEDLKIKDTLKFCIHDRHYAIANSIQNDKLCFFVNDSLVQQTNYKFLYDHMKALEEAKVSSVKQADYENNKPIVISHESKQFHLFVHRLCGFVKQDSSICVNQITLSIAVKDNTKHR